MRRFRFKRSFDQADFNFQVGIWGYAVSGDASEFTALVSEGTAYRFVYQIGGRAWDLKREDIRYWRIKRDEECLPAPLHFALPWVTEWRMRQEMAA